MKLIADLLIIEPCSSLQHFLNSLHFITVLLDTRPKNTQNDHIMIRSQQSIIINNVFVLFHNKLYLNRSSTCLNWICCVNVYCDLFGSCCIKNNNGTTSAYTKSLNHLAIEPSIRGNNQDTQSDYLLLINTWKLIDVHCILTKSR